ncbi:MAG: Ig-like domain-containing protein [Bacillota bacterium]|nr:Ig-like domain-containing protein [Bacillota bacterium]
MREKRMRRVLVWFLLLALVLGQGNMAFAAKPVRPTPEPSSTLDITTGDLTLTVQEDQVINFTVNASTKEEYAIIWGTTTSDYGLLSLTGKTSPIAKPGKKVTAYLQDATFLFEPSDVDSDQTTVFTITAVKPNDSINKDQIKVTIIVTPVEIQMNTPPVAVDDQAEGVKGELLLIEPLLNDFDKDGDTITLVSAELVEGSLTEGINIEGKNIEITPDKPGVIILHYVISDGKTTSQGTITIIVAFVYLALGDSIPAGVSYEYNRTGGIIESYTDKMYISLGNQYTNVVYHDKTISGMNIYLEIDRNPTNELTLYDQVMNDEVTQNYINSADLITLCIGANDIMDAARREIVDLLLFKFTYIDFYDINWDTADNGRATFEKYWPLIIDKIKSINPDVKLMVMTIYNPYNLHDNGTYNVGDGQDPALRIHDQVDFYLSGTSETSRGINTIIRDYEFDNNYIMNYKVVDVYSYFEDYYEDAKGAVTGFYGLPPILQWYPINDPHPDMTGQNEIYNLHFKAYQLMN